MLHAKGATNGERPTVVVVKESTFEKSGLEEEVFRCPACPAVEKLKGVQAAVVSGYFYSL